MRELNRRELLNTQGGLGFWLAVGIVIGVAAIAGYLVGRYSNPKKIKN